MVAMALYIFIISKLRNPNELWSTSLFVRGQPEDGRYPTAEATHEELMKSWSATTPPPRSAKARHIWLRRRGWMYMRGNGAPFPERTPDTPDISWSSPPTMRAGA